MRRIRVSYRPQAIAELEEIYRFVVEISGDRTIAQAFVRRIYDRCQRIGDVPYGGTARDDLADGIRTVPFERRAVIAYRVLADEVEVTNIFYGGRDYEAVYRRVPEGD